MRYHFFLHYGWFLQNFEKDFIPTLLHTTVEFQLCINLYIRINLIFFFASFQSIPVVLVVLAALVALAPLGVLVAQHSEKLMEVLVHITARAMVAATLVLKPMVYTMVIPKVPVSH